MENGAGSYRRFLDGDESAFDEIMNESFRSLVFFINGYVHDVHCAEDIAIDVFTSLVVHKHRYNFKYSLKTYLFMLGRSSALDYLRRNKLLDISDLAEYEAYSDEERTLEEEILADERKYAVNSAIARLSADMRDAVHLVYFENLTYDDAARIMKKNRKQIDNLLFRAKKELHVILGEEGELLL